MGAVDALLAVVAYNGDMRYYDVLVATKHKAFSLFTYSYDTELRPGQVVRVPFRDDVLDGVLTGPAKRHPKAKDIAKITKHSLPSELLAACLAYAEASGMSMSGLAQLLLGACSDRTDFELPAKTQASKLPQLTTDQRAAVDSITSSDGAKPVLLHGVTGSGKTRVYQDLIQQTISSGKSCIVLSPEVGLSKQLYEHIEAASDAPTINYGSHLTKKEREIAWLQCVTSKKPLVIVGPRSSLFLPVQNLGLIILDEFHDDSYRQSSEPRYLSLHAASAICRGSDALLVCGSATPLVEDYYQFEAANYPIVTMNSKALEAQRPKVNIVDMRGDNETLSGEAIRLMKKTIDKGQQVLVFHNRRGSHRIAVCSTCGWTHTCRICEYSMTLHADIHKVICHTCSTTESPHSACPDCGSTISYRAPGVKALEQELIQKFVGTSVARFDSDANKDETLASRLKEIQEANSLIILGTQIISKGLDLPLLGLVVIVNAETSLAIPDFRSEEKMFQQLTQLIGRVGRGHIEDTSVIIQTYNPQHPTLLQAAKEDWSDFYEAEITRRKQAKFPPFRYVATMRIRRKTVSGVETASTRLYSELIKKYPELEIHEPTPAAREKRSFGYEWLIHIFHPKRSKLVELARTYDAKELVELDPPQLF